MGEHGHGRRSAAVLTVSDGVARGARDDASGRAVSEALAASGYEVARTAVVPDERSEIEAALRSLAAEAVLVVTTGGTGFGPRDVTPEATRTVIEREAPGLAEAMRASGRRGTPMADLSRGVAGILAGSLVLNLPGSPRGAVESLEAVLPVLPHALELLEGHTVHGPHDAAPPGADPMAELARRMGAGEAAVLATAVRVHGDPPCRPGQKLLLGPQGPLSGTLGCAEFDAGAAADGPGVLAAGEPALRTYEHDLGSVEVYLEPHRRRPGLVVLGATPVALWLLRWGTGLGYDTALVEPRTERVTAEHKEAAGRVVASPEELSPGPETEAVHTDHDAPAVAEHVAALLRSGARFVGVMGSRRHAGPHLDRLREMGVPQEEVAGIRTPVGLDIGARTPQEIALSILAGLVAARAGRPGAWLDARDGP
ncbi:MAG: molybdopterin-binding protein [Actinomycetota bacterium]